MKWKNELNLFDFLLYKNINHRRVFTKGNNYSSAKSNVLEEFVTVSVEKKSWIVWRCYWRWKSPYRSLENPPNPNRTGWTNLCPPPTNRPPWWKEGWWKEGLLKEGREKVGLEKLTRPPWNRFPPEWKRRPPWNLRLNGEASQAKTANTKATTATNWNKQHHRLVFTLEHS